MKYFKYWIKESFNITVNGAQESICILSGSNVSKQDARAKAAERSLLIEERIETGQRNDSYEAPIREHVSEIIDDSNIITVCRYGAKILNTCQYTILDLDHYPINFMDVFKSLGKLNKKERIVFKFKERLTKNPELGSDFRIYETTKGIRVIAKKYIDPSSKKHYSLMRKFFVDWLYIVLSEKQNCYRARLTPKPYRMKARTIKISNPTDCETQQYLDWAEEYEAASSQYSVVKLLEAIGEDFSREPIIKLHDTTCNAFNNYRLA